MLKTYKYTLIKYIKSPSTWVIFVISCFIAGFLGGYLPYSVINPTSAKAANTYSKAVIIVAATMTTFLSLFVSVFAGFKSATMFKDEVEDGTFLVMLSKPTSRSQIIFGKWLALQTTIAIFTLSTAGFFGLFTLAFDNGDKIADLVKIGANPVSDNLFSITMTIWGILTLMGLIFSSIALLLSTKLSVGATIGISIAIGVFIPITSLLTTLTKKNEFDSINSSSSLLYRSRFKQFVQGAKEQGSTAPTTEVEKSIKELDKLIEDPNGIYSLGLATGETDTFKHLWPFDLNFQINELSSLASEQAIPDSVKLSISSDAQGGGMQGSLSQNIAYDIDKNSVLSKPGHDDFTYLVNYMKDIIPKLAKFDDDKRTYIWNVFKDVLQRAVDKKSGVPNTPLSIALASIDYSPGATHYKELMQAFNINDTKHFNISPTTDFSDVATLKAIFNADQALAKKNIKNKWTYLGYDIDQAMPSDANLVKQWWIPYFKMTQEMYNNKPSGASTDPNYVGHLKLSTMFEAMDALYTGTSLIGDRPVKHNEFCRHNFWGYGSPYNEAALIVAHSNTAAAFLYQLPILVKQNFHSEDMATLVEFMGQMFARSGYIMDYFLDGENLAKFVKDNSIPDFAAGENPLDKELKDVALFPHKNGDRESLSYLFRIAKFRPDLLVKTQSHEYVNRNWILITYLIIALLLVPTSYWVIRRQDYR